MATPYELNMRHHLPYLGVDRYHATGYRGEGVTIVVYDSPIDISDTRLDHDRIVDVNGSTQQRHTGSWPHHGVNTLSVLQQIAPRAEIHHVSIMHDNWTGMMQYVRDIDADIVTASLGSDDDRNTIRSTSQKAVDEGRLLISSAGNSGSEGITWPARKAPWTAVGACQARWDGDRALYRLPYSSTGEELEVMMLSHLYAYAHGDRVMTYGGTSGAAPGMAGCLALYMQRWGKVTNDDLPSIFDDHCLPFGESMEHTGRGLFRLPNVETGGSMKEIVLTIGETTAIIDGETVELEQAPRIDPESDRTVVPLRFVSEHLGADVEWKPANRRIIIRR